MTKTLYYCDLCGKEHPSASKIAQITVSKINSNVDKDTLDLCSSCRDSLIAWLNAKKVANV